MRACGWVESLPLPLPLPLTLSLTLTLTRRSQGSRIDWSDRVLGFDCGGQQWVSEVAFPTGTRAAPSGADLGYMTDLLSRSGLGLGLGLGLGFGLGFGFGFGLAFGLGLGLGLAAACSGGPSVPRSEEPGRSGPDTTLRFSSAEVPGGPKATSGPLALTAGVALRARGVGA